MPWQKQLKGDTLSWLLEHDAPGVRYLAMRDLLELSAENPELISAQERAHKEGPISTILEAMETSGYWVESGPGSSPKYYGTIWSIIMLAQLGASIAFDNRIGRACQYLFDKALTENGQFTQSGTPSGTIDCLQGNLCAAMLDLEFREPRLKKAFEWMARSVTGKA